ncbi:MAG: AAA family ATPase, partial [bacterium]|nr:AAA family ATPase [bacterium]
SPEAPEAVQQYVRFGASPRAAIAMAESARAHALLGGKPNVGFDDVRAVAAHALGHRIALDYRARLDGKTGRDIANAVLDAVPEMETTRA